MTLIDIVCLQGVFATQPEYLPFGGGDRRCIGAAFALFEMKLVLFELVSNWEFAVMNRKPVQPTCRGVTISPSAHFKLRVIQNRHGTSRPISANPIQVD